MREMRQKFSSKEALEQHFNAKHAESHVKHTHAPTKKNGLISMGLMTYFINKKHEYNEKI